MPRPLAAMAVGGMIGAHAAKKSAARQQQAMAQQQQSQAELAQAEAEARAAQQQAYGAPATTAVAYAQPAAPQQQQVYAPPPQQQAPPPPDQGRAMLNEALGDSGGGEASELEYLKKQLTVTQTMCQQANGLYKQSLELNAKAQRTNLMGAVIDRPGNSRAMDNVMNMKRDKEMKAAIAPAEKASQMLVEGFKKIPDQIRLKYPSEMSRVGNVPAARLKVGSFGRDVLMHAAFGQRGENLNDAMMMKKINDNKREIGECMQVVNEQLQLMQIVQARLDQDLAHAQRAAAQPVAQAAPAAQPVAQAAPAAPAQPQYAQPQQPQYAQPQQYAAPAQPSAPVMAPPPPMPAPPPAAMPANMLELHAPHVLDENNPQMQAHKIISVPQGAVVSLVKGDLQNGLGAPYADYIEVNYNGKQGKISRLVVRPAPAGPPPALGVPPAIF